jgi:hypothetical protein
MKTHNRILFHCLCCGNVVHAEPQELIPDCCGKQMVKAAAETVCEAEGDEMTGLAHPATGETPRAEMQLARH